MPRYAYIDALRGYAIFGVILVHASEMVPGLERPLQRFASQGARGVQLFFVASALTLMISWHVRKDGAIPFFVRRFFRIAPMFWLAIIFFTLVSGFAPRYWAPNGIGWPQVFLTAAFLHGWHPATINSVVPGGWSIADEMTFYLIFPALVFLLRSWWSTGLALLFSIALTRVLNPLEVSWFSDQPSYLNEGFRYFWFPNQLFVFLVGMLVFHLSREIGALPKATLESGAAVSAFLILLAPFILVPYPHLVYSLLFGALTLCLSQGAGRWLICLPIRWLGKISFSGYLWHFAILALLPALYQRTGINLVTGNPTHSWAYFLAFFATLLGLTVALSALTYRYIEKSGIAIGHNIAAALVRRSRLTKSGQ